MPATWQTELRVTGVSELVEEILTLERLQADRRGRLLGRIGAQRRAASEPDSVRSLRRAEYFVRRYRTVPAGILDASPVAGLAQWNELCQRSDGVRARAAAACRQEEARVEAVIRRRAADPAFQEAVFLNSPEALRAVRKVADGGRDAYDRRLVVKYLQRFGVKTETASFFGPTNYGHLDAGQVDALRLYAKGGGLAATRHVSMSYWLCQELADACCAVLPVEHQRAYRSAGAPPECARGSAEALVLAGCDGDRPLGEMAAAVAVDPADVSSLVKRWERDGVVRTGLRVPATAADPLAALRSLLPSNVPEARGHLDMIQALESFCRDFERAGLPARERILAKTEASVSAHLGRPVRRGRGEFYADRFIYSEEAVGNVDELVLGAPIIDRMSEDLSVMLDVLASEAVAVRLVHERHVRGLLAGSGPYPASRLLDLDGGATPDTMPAWQRLLPTGSRSVRLTREDLVAAGLIRDDLDQWPLFCAPDVMLVPGREAGQHTLLLAEAHYILPPTQLPLCRFDPLREHAVTELRELLDQALDRTGLLQGVRRLNKALNYTPAGQRIIWLDWHGSEPAAESVALADCQVVEDRAGRLMLQHRDTGEAFWLFPEYDQTSPDAGMLRAVALPGIDKRTISVGRHTPRILIGESIYQRERWDLDGDDLPSARPGSFDAYLEAWRFRERWGLPDQVFVRLPDEEKPFVVDLRSPLSVEVFLRQAAGASRVGIEEMLPVPEQSWLTIDGEPYCAELRLTAVRRRAPVAVPHQGGR